MPVTVNEIKIKDEVIDKEAQQLSDFYKERLSEAEFSRVAPSMREYAKEKLIANVLIEEKAKQRDYQVTAQEIDSELKKMEDHYKGRENFEKKIKAAGTDRETVKQGIAKSLKVDKVIEDLCKDMPQITEEECISLFEQNKQKYQQPEKVNVRHILVKEDANSRARSQLEEVKNKLVNGESFAELASRYSDCPSKDNGGELGFIKRGETVPPFEEAAFALKPGECSDIVKTEYGLHLIYAVDRKEAGQLSYEEAKDNIKQNIFYTRKNERINNFIKKLKKEASISES
ncbi:MAG TPA: peptidylprolyl isomerase [Spirochaetota bacterium]|nr:peptidylprolyl isomerase [Spirochaetota bacterium]